MNDLNMDAGRAPVVRLLSVFDDLPRDTALLRGSSLLQL